MLPFAHFVSGLFIPLAYKKRTIFTYLIAGLISISPDFLLAFAGIFPDVWSEWFHYGIMIPGIFIVGILTWLIFKRFWLGALGILFHLILDLAERFLINPEIRKAGGYFLGDVALIADAQIAVMLLCALIAILLIEKFALEKRGVVS